MKGRGTRTISSTDLNAVTPNVSNKTHFVIVDAIGVCENDKTDSRPLERKKSVPFEKLVDAVALGIRDEDTLTSLAGRLARLDRELGEKEHQEIETTATGKPFKAIIHELLDAVDPDVQQEQAKEMFKTDTPSQEQIKEATEALVQRACQPFDNPKFRKILIDIKKRNEQIIDTVSQDKILVAGFDAAAKEKAQTIVESFKRFIEENKDELSALQIIYSKPYGERHLTYEQIKELAQTIKNPPYHLTPEGVWQAYEQLEKSKVRGAGPQRLLTNIISLVRFAIGESDVLEPFAGTVEQRFKEWLKRQEHLGREFSPEEMAWLTMIRDHIATSLSISLEDFEYAPFHEKGGPVKAYQMFGEELNKILAELNENLAG